MALVLTSSLIVTNYLEIQLNAAVRELTKGPNSPPSAVQPSQYADQAEQAEHAYHAEQAEHHQIKQRGHWIEHHSPFYQNTRSYKQQKGE